MDQVENEALFLILGLCALIIAFGFTANAAGLSRAKALRPLGYALPPIGAFIAHLITLDAPPLMRMFGVSSALLFAMKGTVSIEERLAGKPALGPLVWLSFALLWVGMRPSRFASLGKEKLNGGPLVIRGTANMIIGGGVLVSLFLGYSSYGRVSPRSAVALLGLGLIFHFGIFNVLAGCWRYAGANCKPVCHAPLASSSLSDFWSKRWNRPFSDMLQIALMRQLRERLGPRSGVLLSFMFSGLFHEAAISLPVNAGWGLPTLYFLLQGIAVLLERKMNVLGWRAVYRRVWTILWVVMPLPLVFHEPFMRGIVFSGILGFLPGAPPTP